MEYGLESWRFRKARILLMMILYSHTRVQGGYNIGTYYIQQMKGNFMLFYFMFHQIHNTHLLIIPSIFSVQCQSKQVKFFKNIFIILWFTVLCVYHKHFPTRNVLVALLKCIMKWSGHSHSQTHTELCNICRLLWTWNHWLKNINQNHRSHNIRLYFIIIGDIKEYNSNL